MKQKLTTILLALVFGGATLFCGQAAAAEKKGKTVEAKSQKSRGDAKDENIKSDAQPKNSAGDEGKAAPGKGADKSRGICQIHIDNRTVWWIKIFIDGYYSGTVPPGGDLYPRAISGRTVFYARADFDDGTYRYWGPYSFDCADSYTWLIRY